MHVRTTYESLPMEVLTKYKKVTLTGDVMTVNGLRIVILKSRYIKFTVAQLITNNKQATLLDVILRMRKIYALRGFLIESILMD